MPPKAKLYKSTGKKKNDPQGLSQSTSVSLTSEQEDQFQVELYWCIQQLQSALGSGKLNNKQGLCKLCPVIFTYCTNVNKICCLPVNLDKSNRSNFEQFQFKIFITK